MRSPVIVVGRFAFKFVRVARSRIGQNRDVDKEDRVLAA
jgi:hypothetical protein